MGRKRKRRKKKGAPLFDIPFTLITETIKYVEDFKPTPMIGKPRKRRKGKWN